MMTTNIKLKAEENAMELLRGVETGPDCSEIPFYGTSRFAMGGFEHLKGSKGFATIFEESCIYFVRSVKYEFGEAGDFMLLVEHFEDGMLSAFEYRLNAEDGYKLREELRKHTDMCDRFGSMQGGDDFLKYCTGRKLRVDYTTYWF